MVKIFSTADLSSDTLRRLCLLYQGCFCSPKLHEHLEPSEMHQQPMHQENLLSIIWQYALDQYSSNGSITEGLASAEWTIFHICNNYVMFIQA